jgi:hypothetical protein
LQLPKSVIGSQKFRILKIPPKYFHAISEVTKGQMGGNDIQSVRPFF